jgi:hypothetical protein
MEWQNDQPWPVMPSHIISEAFARSIARLQTWMVAGTFSAQSVISYERPGILGMLTKISL